MEQSLLSRKTARRIAPSMLGAACAAACAGGGRDLPSAPSGTPVSAARAAALRSNGYDAPDVSAAPQNGARVVPASYGVPTYEDGTGPRAAAPVGPYFTPEEAASEAGGGAVPEVPAPPRAAYAAAPRAPLPDLDAIVVTDARPPAPPVRTASLDAAQTFEGETRSVLPERPAAAPAAVPAPTSAPTPAPAPARPRPSFAAPTSTGTAALHLASYRQVAQAEAGWRVLTRDHADVLSALRPGVAEVSLPGRGVFIRLLAGPLTPGEAEVACEALEADGAYCAIAQWPDTQTP